MSNRKLDALFIHPSSNGIYQGLRGEFSAIETPTWSLLLAQSCRSVGYGVAILDCDCLNLTDEQAVQQIKEHNPRLAVFVVYGSEPNQSSVRMGPASTLAKLLKETHPEIKTCFVGNHVSSLPREVISLSGVDYVLLNEGVYAVRNLLGTAADHYKTGIGFKDKHGGRWLNAPERIVPQDRMDFDLPGYAWDLLPDLKAYRSHFWSSFYDHSKRSPYAAIYTSLGCPFKCGFCMIGILNRINNADGVTAADNAVFRYWSAKHTLNQIECLVNRGVRTIRISDEMFALNPVHYQPILQGIKEKWGDSLNLWVYARVDTIKERMLELFRSAGIRWMCLGIESGNQVIRREVSKGSYEEVDVRRVVKMVENSGIEVIANFIAGLPGDTYDTMNEGLDLAISLNTSMYNIYPNMALPGSPLYQEAKNKGIELPSSFAAYGFLSYECTPLPTEHLTSADVLRFRDKAFRTYWGRPEFQKNLADRFGEIAAENVREMLQIRLRRKLLGD